MELEYGFIKVKPKNVTKLSSRKVTKEDGENTQKELNIDTSIDFNRDKDRFLGTVFTKAQYIYNKKTDNTGGELLKSFKLQASFDKKFLKKYRLMLSTALDWVSYGGTKNEKFDSVLQQNITKPTEFKNASLFTFEIKQWEDFILTTGYSISNAPGSKITTTSLNLEMYIPFVKIPLSSKISKQIRNTSGLPRQTVFQEESSITYTYRQIGFELTHIYSKEVLAIDTYTFYEAKGSIIRNFTL